MSKFGFVFFLIIVILTDVKWYLIVVLIYISLIISNIEHLLLSLLGILYVFLKNVHILCPFFILSFVFDTEFYELFL